MAAPPPPLRSAFGTESALLPRVKALEVRVAPESSALSATRAVVPLHEPRARQGMSAPTVSLSRSVSQAELQAYTETLARLAEMRQRYGMERFSLPPSIGPSALRAEQAAEELDQTLQHVSGRPTGWPGSMRARARLTHGLFCAE